MDEPHPATEPPAEPASPSGPGTHILPKLLAAVMVVAIAVGAFIAYSGYVRERDARTAVTRASDLLESAEGDLLTVDAAVQVEISSVTATQAVAAASLAKTVQADALEASSIIDKALGDLPAQQMELARAIKESADARAKMMEIAPSILATDAKAADAIGYADQAVEQIKSAEEVSAQAAVEFNKHTADGVRASDALSVQAEEKLGLAASLLTSATASFPGADFKPFQDYIAAKIGLVGMAKEIDAAWLAGDVAGSNAKLSAYNQRDAEIVAMAKTLPASVRDPIANAYEAQTADALARYFEAREKARVAGERASQLKEAATGSD